MSKQISMYFFYTLQKITELAQVAQQKSNEGIFFNM